MKKRTVGLTEDRCGYLFILPFFLFCVVFVVCPIVINLFLSFTNFNLKSLSFVGFDNFAKLLDDDLFLISLKNTLIYVVGTVFFNMALGLGLALLLSKTMRMGVKFFRSCYYLPYVTSMVSISMVWLWMYEPSSGLFNQIMYAFGLPAQKWLYDEKLAMGSIMFMGIWKSLGYFMTLYLAGLGNIPGYLYEAARVDGANALQRFCGITWPMLRPVTFFILITGTISAFNVFEQVNVMTSGGPMNATTTIVHQIYTRAFTEYQMGYGAAQAVVLMLIILVFALINFRFGNQGQDLDIG